MNDVLYFHDSVCIIRQREIKLYLKVLKNKLFPLFSDVDAEVKKEMKELKDAFGDYIN